MCKVQDFKYLKLRKPNIWDGIRISFSNLYVNNAPFLIGGPTIKNAELFYLYWFLGKYTIISNLKGSVQFEGLVLYLYLKTNKTGKYSKLNVCKLNEFTALPRFSFHFSFLITFLQLCIILVYIYFFNYIEIKTF